MKTFKIINNDIDLVSFDYNSNAIRNVLTERCRIIRGELGYRTSLGIPLGGSKNDIDMAIKNIIFDTFGIKKIIDFTSTISNRKYLANIKIETIYNEEIGVVING